ncbi:MAG: hypothetical protein ABF593_08525 [Acetobacter papayae]|uniref:hypothetical protein n=1 Tax=Acetobacter papayae TaxID=1076592 RepID=UPI0039ED5E5E
MRRRFLLPASITPATWRQRAAFHQFKGHSGPMARAKVATDLQQQEPILPLLLQTLIGKKRKKPRLSLLSGISKKIY